MVVKGGGCNSLLLTRGCSRCIAGRVDQRADRRDGGTRSGRPASNKDLCARFPPPPPRDEAGSSRAMERSS